MADTPEPTEEDAAAVRPFAAFLQEHRAGHLHAEITNHFNELVEKVLDLRKSGEVVIRIKVAPQSAAQVQVTDTVTVKLPQEDPQVSWYFVDKAHNLTRDDPEQLAWGELREVPPPPAAEVREVPQP